MRLEEKREIVEEKYVTVGFECNVCGRKITDDELPETWVAIDQWYKEDMCGGVISGTMDDAHACSPPCLFKYLSDPEWNSTSWLGMSETFRKLLIEFVTPLYAKGELE